MKLKTLLKDISSINVKGSKEIEITGISANSKCVAPGNLFIAKRGKASDGSQYLSEAVAAGAAAVITDIYNPFLSQVTQVIHPDPAALEALISSQFYQDPSSQLYVVGITGTNGKTTCSFLVRHLLEAIGQPCGVIGTIEYLIGNNRYQADRTTPDVITTHRLLREMVNCGCKAAAMEVSSHGLDQNRVAHIDFDAAIFTNLTQDHLDYHQTMEKYAEAKAKLFSSLNPNIKKGGISSEKVAIVNLDDPWSAAMLKNCKVQTITYGIRSQADLQAVDIKLQKDSTQFTVVYKGKRVPFKWKIIGRYNVLNCLAVVALGLSKGLDLEMISTIIPTFQPAMGRLERVPNALGLHIFVDYAHTDDALKNVLECLSEIKTGKIFTIFGCGGNRDHGKRPKMAQAAEQYSDVIIVTSDNPRDEEPMAIINEITSGFVKKKNYQIEPERSKAIEEAIKQATINDVILIAGKGHETYQIFKHKTIEFDDRVVAAEICQRLST